MQYFRLLKNKNLTVNHNKLSAHDLFNKLRGELRFFFSEDDSYPRIYPRCPLPGMSWPGWLVVHRFSIAAAEKVPFITLLRCCYTRTLLAPLLWGLVLFGLPVFIYVCLPMWLPIAREKYEGGKPVPEVPAPSAKLPHLYGPLEGTCKRVWDWQPVIALAVNGSFMNSVITVQAEQSTWFWMWESSCRTYLKALAILLLHSMSSYIPFAWLIIDGWFAWLFRTSFSSTYLRTGFKKV